MHAGLQLAPQFVGEALKGGRLVAEVMARQGYTVTPASTAPVDTPSFITAVTMGSAAAMVAFCEGVQMNSPVGSYIQPTPGMLSCAWQTSNALDTCLFNVSGNDAAAWACVEPVHIWALPRFVHACQVHSCALQAYRLKVCDLIDLFVRCPSTDPCCGSGCTGARVLAPAEFSIGI